MDFGAVTHAVGHSFSFEKTLATIRGLGFSSVLLLTSRDGEPVRPDGTCPQPFPDVLHSDPEHVVKALKHAGLGLGALHVAFGKIDVESDQGIDEAMAHLREYAMLAVAMGCKFVTLPTPSCGRAHVPTQEKATEIRRFARLMNTVAEAFAGEGIRVGCDIHHRAWVEGLDDCRLLLDSMPCENAGILMNIGHLTTAQSYGWLLVDEYPGRIPVVGWKDHSLARDRPRPMWSIELGTGHSPFELYIRRFKKHPDARIHLVNCEHVPDEARVATLERSLKYMQTLWEEVS